MKKVTFLSDISAKPPPLFIKYFACQMQTAFILQSKWPYLYLVYTVDFNIPYRDNRLRQFFSIHCFLNQRGQTNIYLVCFFQFVFYLYNNLGSFYQSKFQSSTSTSVQKIGILRISLRKGILKSDVHITISLLTESNGVNMSLKGRNVYYRINVTK